MDKDGCYNLIIAVVRQAAADYRSSYNTGDLIRCRAINNQINQNQLIGAAGLTDVWNYFISQLHKGGKHDKRGKKATTRRIPANP